MGTAEDALAGAHVVAQHRTHSRTLFLYVWAGLLIITAIEVFLAYQHLKPVHMLSILMGLSVMKAALIISYFMHLKFEMKRMKFLLMASLVACLCLMSGFLPDAFRILSLGVR
jgi:caa(3)-type oxidase subunit IV